MDGKILKNRNNKSLTKLLLFLKGEENKKGLLEISMDWHGQINMGYVE